MTEKMSKILFIIDHLGCGGAERITLQLAEYLAANDHSIHLAVLNGRLNYYQCKATASIDYTDLQLCESFAYGKMWKNKVLSPDEKTKIDTLLTNNFDLIITGYNNGHWLAPYLKGNVWHWIHGDLLEFRNFNNPLKQIKEHIRFFKNKRKFSKLFNHKNLITVNRDLENKAKTYANPSCVRTIANGVQISEDLITRSQSTSKKWDVIFVGRFVQIKLVDHAIIAFALSNLSGKMAIVGDGPERQKLEALARELGISDRVDFLGWVDNPHQFMLKSKCLVLCSLYEGSPVTLAEAISLGVPVVTYNSSLGIKDLFSSDIMQCALVNKQDIQGLTSALSQCIQTPYSYSVECMNKVCMKNMEKRFTSLI